MNANERDFSKYLDLLNDKKKPKQEQQTKPNSKQKQTNHLPSQGKYYFVSTSNGGIASIQSTNKNSISCSSLSLRSSLEIFSLPLLKSSNFY